MVNKITSCYKFISHSGVPERTSKNQNLKQPYKH